MQQQHSKPAPRLSLDGNRLQHLQAGGTLKGKPLRHSVAIESRYIAELMRMVNQMVQQVERELIREIKAAYAMHSLTGDAAGDDEESLRATRKAAREAAAKKGEASVASATSKFDNLFNRRAKHSASTMLEAVTKESAVNLSGSLKELSGTMTVKMDFMDKAVGKTIKGALAENAKLITNIPTQYRERLNKVLATSAEAGGDMTSLIDKVQAAGNMERRRAKNIALDQTRKAYNTINGERLKAVGVKRFEWVHSGGGMKPRESHIKSHLAGGLNGGIYELAKGAYDPDADMWILPAELPNCRCTMVPVIEDDDGVDADGVLPEPAITAPADTVPAMPSEFPLHGTPLAAGEVRPLATGVSAGGFQMASITDTTMEGFEKLREIHRGIEALPESGASLPVHELDLKTIKATQEGLNQSQMEDIASGKPFGNDFFGVQEPVVAVVRGENIIIDGHHRLAAMKASGKQTAAVRLYQPEAMARPAPTPDILPAARPADIKGFPVSRSVNDTPMKHATKAEHLDSITTSGMKVSSNSMYGQGVYFSSADLTGGSLGDSLLHATLKDHLQLDLESEGDVLSMFDKVTGLNRAYLGTEKGRQALLDAGIGSYKFPLEGTSEKYTVVLDPKLIDVQVVKRPAPVAAAEPVPPAAAPAVTPRPAPAPARTLSEAEPKPAPVPEEIKRPADAPAAAIPPPPTPLKPDEAGWRRAGFSEEKIAKLHKSYQESNERMQADYQKKLASLREQAAAPAPVPKPKVAAPKSPAAKPAAAKPALPTMPRPAIPAARPAAAPRATAAEKEAARIEAAKIKKAMALAAANQKKAAAAAAKEVAKREKAMAKKLVEPKKPEPISPALAAEKELAAARRAKALATTSAKHAHADTLIRKAEAKVALTRPIPPQQAIARPVPQVTPPAAQQLKQVHPSVPQAVSSTMAKVEDYNREGLKHWAAHSGMDTHQFKQAVDAELAKFTEKADIYHRTSDYALARILESGRFKSQFEGVGSLGGLEDTKVRTLVENRTMSVPENIAPEKRPIYGYLRDKPFGLGDDDHVDMYGDIAIRMKPAVKDRATFTIGDSLSNSQWGDVHSLHAAPVNAPSHSVFRMRKTSEGNPLEELREGKIDERYSYAEAQMHGGVDTGDIEHIYFRKGQEPSRKLVLLLEQHRIPYTVLESDY